MKKKRQAENDTGRERPRSPSKQNHLADLCSRAFMTDANFSNFNKILKQGIIKLDYVHYDKFYFQNDL